MIYFTELDHAPVFDAKGELLGHLSDMAVNPAREPLRVSAYLVKTPKKNMLHLSYEQVQSISIQQIQTSVPAESVEPYAPDEGQWSPLGGPSQAAARSARRRPGALLPAEIANRYESEDDRVNGHGQQRRI